MFNQLKKYKLASSIITLVIFYTVGLIGLSVMEDTTYFISLTPLIICITSLFLFLNHQKWSSGLIFKLVLIALLGLSVEIIGVNTGYPFGTYSYSSILGVQVLETPLIIGLNWLMLVYSAYFTFKPLIKNRIIRILVSSSVLLMLDLIMEPVAIASNFWTWTSEAVPLENYLSWGAFALIFCGILTVKEKKEENNNIAPVVLLIQFIFFITLSI